MVYSIVRRDDLPPRPLQWVCDAHAGLARLASTLAAEKAARSASTSRRLHQMAFGERVRLWEKQAPVGVDYGLGQTLERIAWSTTAFRERVARA